MAYSSPEALEEDCNNDGHRLCAMVAEGSCWPGRRLQWEPPHSVKLTVRASGAQEADKDNESEDLMREHGVLNRILLIHE